MDSRDEAKAGVIVKNQLELSKADWMATSKLYAWLAEADFEQSA
jgi:hypothetical protein